MKMICFLHSATLVVLIHLQPSLAFHHHCYAKGIRSTAISSALGLFGKNKNDSNLDKGFNLLETASKLVPQGTIVYTAKESWKFAWKRMMAELAPQDKKTGSYQRPSYTFNNKIGDVGFPDERNRYHVYLGNPCPWCHRVKLILALRDISSEDEVGVTTLIDDPTKASRGGWIFNPNAKQNRDPLNNSNDLRELYDELNPGYEGRCTAPLLIDLKKKRIVSNESSEIVRMLNSASFGQSSSRMDLYPSELAEKIDETNKWVYELINNGVYKCGFSTEQSSYDNASQNVRKGLDRCEEILSNQDYLCSPDMFTESDLYLLPTILRYDAVYAPLFRAGGSHLRIRVDYPNIHRWLKRCWSDVHPDIPGTIDIEDANSSYYKQLFPLNPGGLIPTTVTAKDLGLED